MTRRVTLLLAPVALLVALALPTGAQADPGAVVRDCASDGSVDGNYSDADKRAALGQIPADLDEYSNCRSVISGSIGGGSGKAKASDNGSGGGAVAAGAAGAAGGAKVTKSVSKHKKSAERAKKRKKTEAVLGDRQVDPRNAGVFKAADTNNGLPTPVLLALIALGVLCVAGGLLALGRRKPGVAGVLRRVSFPRPRR
jgi:hypothetical protein